MRYGIFVNLNLNNESITKEALRAREYIINELMKKGLEFVGQGVGFGGFDMELDLKLSSISITIPALKEEIQKHLNDLGLPQSKLYIRIISPTYDFIKDDIFDIQSFTEKTGIECR